ncbi:VOC family protein [Ktedonobacter racemifer]|uniref:Glyoxalase/bleomycin resistance protein/dioxygenase n=1 Tax=Ktedonobacter racemifer DSM 44963 TaxID=485913 RepID=D6U7P4_KTERA|nr:VOC family protein [Ktedonobacter racemifer]EFH79905.1 Glyoxalase/bleomycin resistance protein/dioxygenase [Ktedonobacter racemifer DSM 44963]
MKLNYIPLIVTDFPAAVRFWRDVAKLPLTYSDEATGFASFDTGSTTLLLLSSTLANASKIATSEQSQAHSMYLSFQVEDVDASYAELLAGGATSVYEPQDFSHMQARQAHVTDPDGHLVELYTPFPKA